VDIAIKTKSCARAALAPLLAAALLFSVGTTIARGQTNQPMQPVPPTANPTNPMPVGPTPRPTPPDDITRREIAEMNQFLDAHPEIAEQLRKDPSLIDNRKWVSDHPGLQEYLQNHPVVAQAFRENPNLFMRDEERYDQRDDISRRDVEEMGHFLNGHPEIAEQLRKDPSLIDNRQWVANHPALQEYLQTHPQVADAFRAHPDAFMRDEDRYDHHDDRIGARVGDERNRGELTSFGQFLGGHSSLAAELSGDPSLANNKEYLATHPELDEYLKTHPAMSQQLAENPQAVMNSNWVQQNGGFNPKPVGPTPKPKSGPNQ
jgi:hypothetical protein